MRHPLHSICPYFAMFPETFVEEKVRSYTKRGDLVLDPFSGRGTTVFQSLLMKREAIGIDVNPVAYVISGAKARPPSLQAVRSKIGILNRQFGEEERDQFVAQRNNLPSFFRRCFFHDTLDQILFVRRELQWRHNTLDRFVAALALGSLHGETPSYFSNQMPRIISPKPRYALKYWNEHRLWPKKRDVFRILLQRAAFRLTEERPLMQGTVHLGDVRNASAIHEDQLGKVKLIVTSPPYYDVTNYEEDNWLRLWFLGGPPHPTTGLVSHDDRYYKLEEYWQFLREAWRGVEPLISPRAKMVLRIGGSGLTAAKISNPLLETVRDAFPNARLTRKPTSSQLRNRQANRFRPGSDGIRREFDFVFAFGNN